MKILLALALFFTPVSIYTLSPPSISGGTIPLSQYEGKCILITNIATGSVYAPQLAELQQLYQSHSSKLVVIAVPSNSFGHEPRSNAQIAAYLDSAYGITFPVTAKYNVTDSLAPVDPLYQWLTGKYQNGVFSSEVGGDFQKYLINKQGKLVGIFDSATSPISAPVLQALQIHE
jgi:glutathione peroxidase